jgi:hypothetical protein
MDNYRRDIAEKMKQLADSIMSDEGISDLESLKREHMKIYDDLVKLETNWIKSESLVYEAPEPMSEQDEVIVEKSDSIDSVQEEPFPKQAVEEEAAKEEAVIEEAVKEDVFKEGADDQNLEERKPEEQEYPTLSDLFVPTFNDIKEDMSQKEEFKDTVSLDETEKLFETKKEEIRQLSLNDRLVGSSIQIGLNDRIAFVNKLFNFSQSDFNKVLAHLNACATRDEALHYVQYQVKSNYNWKGKEELEERFISLIERKFIS